MATSKGSQSGSVYKASNRFASNRKARLERALKAQPNNEQIKLALKDNRQYRRKTPTTPYWSHTMIREAMLFKEFTGRMDLGVFSSNEVARANARLHLRREDWSNTTVPEGKISFSLGARAHDGTGRLVWA